MTEKIKGYDATNDKWVRLQCTPDGLLMVDTEAVPPIVGDDTVEHLDGSAVVGGAIVTFGARSKALHIENMDTVNDLLVSMDGGTKFKTIEPGAAIGLDVRLESVKVKSSALTALYEILVVNAQ